MADDAATQSTSAWPLPKFYFQVQWGSQIMSFQEVSGLDIETQAIEFRAGNSPDFAVTQMPGVKKYTNVTMKKGVFVSDNKFWDWYSEIKMNTVKRSTVTISLLDETGAATMVWVLANAWPAKITGSNLDSNANEVAIESIEIAHQGISIESR